MEMRKKTIAVAAGRIKISALEYEKHLKNGEKYCYKCKTWKLHKQFGKAVQRHDGLNPICKPCLREEWQRKYIRHPKQVMTEQELKLSRKASKQKWYQEKKIEKFGEALVGVDMRGWKLRPMKGPDSPRWNRGNLISSHGYVLSRVPKDHPLAFGEGYAYEHDLIMYQHTGRLPNETWLVHHKNQNKLDNRFENLEWKTRGKHVSDHWVIRKQKSAKTWPNGRKI
jgi:hypothetical protein